FGTVYAAVDNVEKKPIAVKIQRPGRKLSQVALDEISLLRVVREKLEEDEGESPRRCSGGRHVVRIFGHFVHKGLSGMQVCTQLELLGPSLLDLLKDCKYKGLPLPLVKVITRDVLRGLHFLHERCNIIHTDLKPENVLLSVRPVHAKIVDLGNACLKDKKFTEDIQTIEYRSPEVIVGSGYDASADMWSLACMVFELITGEYLFDPKECTAHGKLLYSREEDLLAHQQELLGLMPLALTKGGRRFKEFFKPNGELRNIFSLKFWALPQVLQQKYKMKEEVAAQVSDFLLPMLKFNPKERATALEMLNHPWLTAEEEEVKAEVKEGAVKGGQEERKEEEGREESQGTEKR
ncbi:hypothetical protein GUITHDRAFT_72980, partial [Guillardia theta CCMP2712]